MDRQDRILLLKGQIRCDMKSIFLDEDTGLYNVVFSNGKRFNYKSENVLYVYRDEDLPMPVRVTHAQTGKVFSDVLGVSTFVPHEFLGGKAAAYAYRVVFKNGTNREYLASELLVEKHVKGERAKNVFNYMKDLSNFSRIPVDDDKVISLSQKYARVSAITELSPLADYMKPEGKKGNGAVLGGDMDWKHPIFPFGCNRSQYKAVTEALRSKISVIQGPPGTGKTQTILNIVANLIIAGKNVEIVSNNNSAVLNVAEKLGKQKYGLSWMVAYLGSSINKEAFYEGQTGVYPDTSSWDREDFSEIKKEISGLSERLQNGYENLERLAEMREELRQTRLQHDRYMSTEDGATRDLRKVKTSTEALDLMERINECMDMKGKLGLMARLKFRMKGLADPVSEFASLERTFYSRRLKEIEDYIDSCEDDVESIGRNEERLVDLSLKYMHGKIYKMFRWDKGRPVFTRQEVERGDPQPFLKEYPVVLSTTFSATTNINSAYPFDYIIMDEASQVDVSAGSLAMNASRNAVIVGDEKQLPNVVTDDDRIAAEMLIRKYDIPSDYEFTENSFLSSLCKVLKDVPVTLLREHYRCAPAIIGFCNKQFYDGALIAMTKEGDGPSLRMWTTGEGDFARGAVNRRQAEMIAKEVLPDIAGSYKDIGIIAPYNEQVSTIASCLAAEGFGSIPVATVHKFQGRENDVIVMSTVDNQIRSFVDDPHMLNVAVSRAKKLFVLVVSGNEQPASNVKDLMDYIRYSNGEVFQTSIRSVFDLLYKQMSERRREFLSRHRNVSKFASENIMCALIDDILKESRFSRYKVTNNYPLRAIVSADAPLNEEEMTFARRSWSHIDFIIYDVFTYEPVLAIEVDGTSFHFEGSDQSKRDHIKDSILGKIGLPLLRLSTDGSAERSKIEAVLSDVTAKK